MNHKKMLRFMQFLTIRSCARKKCRYTYPAYAVGLVTENAFKQSFGGKKPNEKVTDITRVQIDESWLYLARYPRHIQQ